jgi:sugar (glycoside-pentoside-hexuronide) transporter
MNTTTGAVGFNMKTRNKLGYSLSESANNLHAHTDMFCLTYFLTDVFLLNPFFITLLLVIARTYDALVDPFIGFAMDHNRSRWGTYRPFLVVIAIPVAVVKVLTYTFPGFSETGNVIYLMSFMIIGSMLYTSISLTNAALIPVMTQDTKERNSLAGFKVVVGMITTLVIAVFWNPFYIALSGGAQAGIEARRGGFQLMIIIFMAISVVFYFITFFNTRENIIRTEKDRYSIKLVYRMLRANKPLFFLCVSTLFAMMVKIIAVGAGIYYFQYYVKNTELYMFFSLVLMLSVVAGSVLTPMLANKIGKKNTYVRSNLFATIGCIMLFFAPPGNTVLIFVAASIMGLGVAPAFVLLFTMSADTVEYGELKTGIRAEGLITSIVQLFIKLAAALSGGIMSLILGITGYIPNAEQTPIALMGIKSMLSLLPLVFTVLALVFILFYKLDEKEYERVVKELSLRKAGEHA